MKTLQNNKQLSNFDFAGDFDFTEQDAWLQFRIPMPVLRELIAGPSGRQLFITRKEILSLLRAIQENPETSQTYRDVIHSLLKPRR